MSKGSKNGLKEARNLTKSLVWEIKGSSNNPLVLSLKLDTEKEFKQIIQFKLKKHSPFLKLRIIKCPKSRCMRRMTKRVKEAKDGAMN